MKYLPTAFTQLEFAWKLYNYALEGGIDFARLDVPVTFTEGNALLVLPDRIFESREDMILALENNLGVAFGAAAITLNRCREDAKIPLPDPIKSDVDQFVGLTYQIRNAFAHDIAEPRWNIRERFRRSYEFGPVSANLSNLHDTPFDYHQIGGPEVLFWMRDFGSTQVWASKVSASL
jgi:hypothetical protein